MDQNVIALLGIEYQLLILQRLLQLIPDLNWHLFGM